MRKKNKAKVKIKTSRVARKRPVGRKKSAVVVKIKRKTWRKRKKKKAREKRVSQKKLLVQCLILTRKINKKGKKEFWKRYFLLPNIRSEIYSAQCLLG